MSSNSSLLLGPPGSYAGHILFQLAFSHAIHSPVIVLVNLETEAWSVREQYSGWCVARELEQSKNLHTVHGTWLCSDIEALRHTISDQVDSSVLDNVKLLIVRDLSSGLTMTPENHWLKLASELSRELHCRVLSSGQWGGRVRLPQEELASYPCDDLARVELGYDLKVKIYPKSDDPLEYKGKQHANMYITFDLQDKEPSHV
jgi:hypothetical protein